jgi:hypothetical protein
MKKIYITSGIVLIFALLILTRGGQPTTAIDSTTLHSQVASSDTTSTPVSLQEEDMLTVSSQASFLTNFNSVEKLVNASTTVVEGEVIGLEYFDFKTNTFTKAKIKVLNSFTDDVKAGDVVTFIDLGGITTLYSIRSNSGGQDKPGAAPITEKDKTTKVQVLFDGCPLLRLNDKVVLFGVEDKLNLYQTPGKNYALTGAHQGKMVFKGDVAERYSSTNLNMPRENLHAQIKDAFKNKNKVSYLVH